MDAEAVKWIGRAALAALAAGAVWQASLPVFDVQGRTRFARELRAARGDARREVAGGWAFRRWVVYTVAPVAIMLAAGTALRKATPGGADAIAWGVVPMGFALLGAWWDFMSAIVLLKRARREAGEE
ncbi:MAG: hypothetical protein FDZ70_06295 [Actinobacteria bacterium]|nr:MAG: hypothetical protein FDZ70_06295 [Actinomycetota bacterium]